MLPRTSIKKVFGPMSIVLATLPLAPVLVAAGAVPVGTTPFSLAVNPVTNKIYVANAGSNTVTVIDGATNAAITLPVEGLLENFTQSVSVNPVTNKIYVASYYGSVTVIDGAPTPPQLCRGWSFRVR